MDDKELLERAAKAAKMDCLYGGGGHAKAAGFKVPRGLVLAVV